MKVGTGYAEIGSRANSAATVEIGLCAVKEKIDSAARSIATCSLISEKRALDSTDVPEKEGLSSDQTVRCSCGTTGSTPMNKRLQAEMQNRSHVMSESRGSLSSINCHKIAVTAL